MKLNNENIQCDMILLSIHSKIPYMFTRIITTQIIAISQPLYHNRKSYLSCPLKLNLKISCNTSCSSYCETFQLYCIPIVLYHKEFKQIMITLYYMMGFPNGPSFMLLSRWSFCFGKFIKLAASLFKYF